MWVLVDVKDTRLKLEEDASRGVEARSVLPLVYERRFVRLKTPGGRDIWVYMGPRSDYVIIPGTYCSCMDFSVRVVSRSSYPYCKHLLGLEVALRRNLYRDLEVGESDAVGIVREILSQGFSRTLRRLLK